MLEYSGIFAVGILAGFIGGLLGLGGGVVVMPFLRFILGLAPMQAVGTCIVAVFFTTLGGSIRHYRLGHINLRSIYPVILSGVVSTILFSLLFPQFSRRQNWLDLGIGLIFAFVSVRMITEGMQNRKTDASASSDSTGIHGYPAGKIVLGSAAGIFPGLLGIGTGCILVPAFTFYFGASVKVAMGSSLACFTANAFWSSLTKLYQGFVDLNVAVPISIATLIGANFGAVVNKKFPSSRLKVIFGILFAYVSLKFIFSAWGIKI